MSPDIIVAVNKMDCLGYDQRVFARIEDEYRRRTQGLNFRSVTCVPVSALRESGPSQVLVGGVDNIGLGHHSDLYFVDIIVWSAMLGNIQSCTFAGRGRIAK